MVAYMKTKFNLVGNTFTHLTGGNKGYSVHGKVSKNIEWVQDWSGKDTFYIDAAFGSVFNDGVPGRKYLWLLESKWISSAIDTMKNNWEHNSSPFDMIFTHDQELLALDDKFKFVPAQGSWIQEPRIYNKTKLASMISSGKSWTEGHRFRLDWVDRLRGKVNLYGREFNPIQLKEHGLCDYMFSVAIENGSYETYFTEKLLDCFLTGTIPIYHGAPDVGNYFNMDGILTLDEFDSISPELYYSKMYAIKDNLERALKMEVLEDFIYTNYLKES